MKIDRKFKCIRCNSDNVDYNIRIRQEFSITYPDFGFCHSCKDRTYILETESSKQEFEKTKIVRGE
jgi:transcription elongation factor Elf1